jgi:hypothetical protein
MSALEMACAIVLRDWDPKNTVKQSEFAQQCGVIANTSGGLFEDGDGFNIQSQSKKGRKQPPPRQERCPTVLALGTRYSDGDTRRIQLFGKCRHQRRLADARFAEHYKETFAAITCFIECALE